MVKLKRLDYPNDVLLIQKAVITHGYACSLLEAQQLWIDYSNSLCAGWIVISTENSGWIWKQVEPFVVVDYEE